MSKFEVILHVEANALGHTLGLLDSKTIIKIEQIANGKAVEASKKQREFFTRKYGGAHKLGNGKKSSDLIGEFLDAGPKTTKQVASMLKKHGFKPATASPMLSRMKNNGEVWRNDTTKKWSHA
jgi:hypothetical protein